MVTVAEEMTRQGFKLPLLIGGATTVEGAHRAAGSRRATTARPCTCSMPRARSACARRWSRSWARRRATSRPRSRPNTSRSASSAAPAGKEKLGPLAAGARQRLQDRLVGLHAAQAGADSARASSPSIRCTSWSSASTGRRSSAPGSWPATIRPSSRTRWWARARASSSPTRARCSTASCARSG